MFLLSNNHQFNIPKKNSNKPSKYEGQGFSFQKKNFLSLNIKNLKTASKNNLMNNLNKKDNSRRLVSSGKSMGIC